MQTLREEPIQLCVSTIERLWIGLSSLVGETTTYALFNRAYNLALKEHPVLTELALKNIGFDFRGVGRLDPAAQLNLSIALRSLIDSLLQTLHTMTGDSLTYRLNGILAPMRRSYGAAS